MTRRLTGAVASALVFLVGAWLVLSPFALGTQPEGADWTDATMTEVWTGIGLGALGLLGLVAFLAALRQHLVDRGYVTRRAPARAARQPAAPTPPPAAAAQPAPQPSVAGSGESGDLDKLLAPLIAALTEDITRERQGRGPNGSAQPDHTGYGFPEVAQSGGKERAL